VAEVIPSRDDTTHAYCITALLPAKKNSSKACSYYRSIGSVDAYFEL